MESTPVTRIFGPPHDKPLPRPAQGRPARGVWRGLPARASGAGRPAAGVQAQAASCTMKLALTEPFHSSARR